MQKKDKIKIPKVRLKKEHKGHETVKIMTRRRAMYFCKTCDKWLAQKRSEHESLEK